MSADVAGRRLPVLEVDLGPGVRAGFTTRHGGTSPAPWDSLNLGLGVDDDAARVRAHRALVGGWLGVPVVFATQVHGTAVLTVGTPQDVRTADGGHAQADALVGAGVGIGVGVLVADCVPVLLADAAAGVVGAVHAGRRGLAAGVVAAGVAAMVEAGARTDRLRAVVGPAACGACYEVPDALRAEVSARLPQTWSTTSWGTPALDLPAGATAELAAAGVGAERVSRLARCTLEDDDLYSHRRARGGGTGRFAGVVAALP